MRLNTKLFALCWLALAATPARADDAPVATAGAAGAPPAAAAPVAALPGENSPEAIGAWARGVMAGGAAEPPRQTARGPCPANDGKPHGEVTAGIGTGGYREVGGVVTQPIGACSQMTIGVSHAEARGRWR